MNSVFVDKLFEGTVALVTGGGSGIGLRTARELAQLGSTVVLAGRSLEKLEPSAEVILSEGGKAYYTQCNIREEASVQQCIHFCIEKAGGLNHLVNNAGGQFPSAAEHISRKGWQAVIDTNLNSTFFVTQTAFKEIFHKQGGCIVNVIANMWNGFPTMSHTGAARAGVENLTKSLAVEWGRYGIRINSVAPGTIDSSGLSSYDENIQKKIRATKRHNQLYRLGTEAEVASAIIYLLSPAASFITGETLKVDGGESLYSPLHPPIEPSI